MAKLLIVEDDESQRLLYEEELQEEGYEVVLAKNGKEALKCLERTLFDLIILDIRMPEMDGTEALGKIASRYKETPVILHTAYPEYRNQFIALLADAFILKSSDLSLLKKAVKELLEEKNRERRNENGRRETLARRNEDPSEHRLFMLWGTIKHRYYQCPGQSRSSQRIRAGKGSHRLPGGVAGEDSPRYGEDKGSQEGCHGGWLPL